MWRGLRISARRWKAAARPEPLPGPDTATPLVPAPAAGSTHLGPARPSRPGAAQSAAGGGAAQRSPWKAGSGPWPEESRSPPSPPSPGSPDLLPLPRPRNLAALDWTRRGRVLPGTWACPRRGVRGAAARGGERRAGARGCARPAQPLLPLVSRRSCR